MILSFIVGYLFGRSFGKSIKGIILTIVVGVVMGIFGGLETIPIVYPFYAARPLDWMGLPEYRPVALYFAFPYFKLHQEVILMYDFSIVSIAVLTAISVLGVLLGFALGTRMFKKSDLWLSENQ